MCTDEYWSQIASDDDNCVIIDANVLSHSPCLDEVSRRKIQIFVTVDVSDVSIENIMEKIMAITESSPVGLSGIHLKNPERQNT